MKKKAALVALLVVLLLAALGYGSSLVSTRACAIRTAEQFKTPREGVIWVQIHPPDSRLKEIWAASGVPHAIWEPAPGSLPWESPPMPWARIQRAAVRAPFLVSVEYGWTREALVGGGGHAWYLSLFGWTFHLGDSITWQT